MDDLFYLAIGVVFVFISGALLSLFMAIHSRRSHGCRHQWGNWLSRNTDNVFIQERVCLKCGYTDIEQQRRL